MRAALVAIVPDEDSLVALRTCAGEEFEHSVGTVATQIVRCADMHVAIELVVELFATHLARCACSVRCALAHQYHVRTT